MKGVPPSPFLYPIADPAALGEDKIGDWIRRVAGAGARILQLRAKELSDRRFLDLAREARSAAREAGALLLVNDRPDLARIAEADGVHLGQQDLPPSAARRIVGEDAIIGLSTHTLDELHVGIDDPCVDYIAVGPVFPTGSKERPEAVVGTSFVAAARRLTRKPLVAIGGISAVNAAEVLRAGADGLAVISALSKASDPGAAFQALRASLG